MVKVFLLIIMQLFLARGSSAHVRDIIFRYARMREIMRVWARQVLSLYRSILMRHILGE